MKDACEASGIEQRELGEIVNAAQSRARQRLVITRLESGPQGTNPRCVVTHPP